MSLSCSTLLLFYSLSKLYSCFFNIFCSVVLNTSVSESHRKFVQPSQTPMTPDMQVCSLCDHSGIQAQGAAAVFCTSAMVTTEIQENKWNMQNFFRLRVSSDLLSLCFIQLAWANPKFWDERNIFLLSRKNFKVIWQRVKIQEGMKNWGNDPSLC